MRKIDSKSVKPKVGQVINLSHISALLSLYVQPSLSESDGIQESLFMCDLERMPQDPEQMDEYQQQKSHVPG